MPHNMSHDLQPFVTYTKCEIIHKCYEAISFVARLFLVTKRNVEGAKYVGSKRRELVVWEGKDVGFVNFTFSF